MSILADAPLSIVDPRGGISPPVQGNALITLDFTQGVLPSGATLTRASAASYYTSAGVLSQAAINAARFDYNPSTLANLGILIEAAATNSFTNSNIANWAAAMSVITPNAAVSPDGSTNATSLIDNTTNVLHDASQSIATTINTYTYSMYAKTNIQTSFQMAASITGGAFSTFEWYNFDLNAGVVGTGGASATPAIQNIGNGWYRCSIALASTAVVASEGLLAILNNSNPSGARAPVYVGTGTGVFLYGAQIEIGTSTTSYIPTSGATATRSADVLTFTIPTGVSNLTFTFDDLSQQVIAATPGSYTVPTNLNRPWIKTITGA